MKSARFLLLLLGISLVAAYGQDPQRGISQGQQMPERTRLYDEPDPTCQGGIKGQISDPQGAIQQILAIPLDSPDVAYKGQISGEKSDCFQFAGLPAGKYDLLVAFDKDFYEGLSLSREENNLKPEDLKKIETTIQTSEPFFPHKYVHRIEGETGHGKIARSIVTYFRDKSSDFMGTKWKGQFKRDDFRVTYKLVTLKDVGPGWQIARARDLYPIWMDPKHPLPKHHFSAAISKIRVADSLKDIGRLDLSH